MSNKDTLFNSKRNRVAPFEFNNQVASVFEDMIMRSVPGYQNTLHLIPTLVRDLLRKKNSAEPFVAYDLGCSLGAGIQAITSAIEPQTQATSTAKIVGIDNAPAMLAQAAEQLKQVGEHPSIELELLNSDITATELESSDLILMHYTLQFIALEQRDLVIEKLYQSLKPEGVLVLSEKLKFEPAKVNDLLTHLHHQFKKDQGYSDLEISQKRDSIETVLIPETLQAHIDRLDHVGFTTVTPWIQNLQFASIIAIK